jgi:spore maturation protein CgeB
VVFIGNTRGVPRQPVLWAAELGLPLRVWGRGWEEFLDPGYLVDREIPADQIPAQFAKAKCTLNDHWPDMRRLGYVNDRVFDALASGLPLISDHLEELQRLFPGVCLLYKNKREFADCVERLWLEYPRVLARAREASAAVRSDHSFDNRARRLIEILSA